MPERTTTLRLRRVRFKDGRTIEVLRPRQTASENLHARWRTHVSGLLDARMGAVSGYAVVAWEADGTSIAVLETDGKYMPSILVPDFVRNRLLAQKIEDWTIETLDER